MDPRDNSPWGALGRKLAQTLQQTEPMGDWRRREDVARWLLEAEAGLRRAQAYLREGTADARPEYARARAWMDDAARVAQRLLDESAEAPGVDAWRSFPDPNSRRPAR